MLQCSVATALKDAEQEASEEIARSDALLAAWRAMRKQADAVAPVTTHHERPLQPVVARRGRCDVCKAQVAAGEQIMGTADHGFYKCAHCVLLEGGDPQEAQAQAQAFALTVHPLMGHGHGLERGH